MKKFAILLAITLPLMGASCGQGDPNVLGKDAVAKLIKAAVETGCGVTPSVIDIATSLGGQALGPAGVLAAPLANKFAKDYAKQICDQWAMKQQSNALVGDKVCIAVMNGVCIHKGD